MEESSLKKQLDEYDDTLMQMKNVDGLLKKCENLFGKS